MSASIKYRIIKYKYFKGDKWIFSSYKKYTDNEIDTIFNDYYKNIPSEMYSGDYSMKELPEPTTFPKFSNETKFKFKDYKTWIYNPKIKNIQWNGNTENWEYCLENIGHVHDYQPEHKLKAI